MVDKYILFFLLNKINLRLHRYGPAAMVYQIANYTIDAMMHLVLNEFTQPERESKVGVMVSSFLFCFSFQVIRTLCDSALA